VTERDVRKILEAAGKPFGDVTGIRRYARALTLADRAHDEIPEDSLIGATDRQGDKVHPSVTAWLALERAAIEFGVRLGIEVDRTVKLDIGRPVAAVSAPDRAAEPPRIRRVK
jgi:hypothetical protein